MTFSGTLPIELDLDPRPEDIASVRAGLMAFNDDFAGPAPLPVVARICVRDSLEFA